LTHSRRMTMASVDIYPSPVVAEAQGGHPDASNGHSFLRGDPNIHPSKTGVQRRIDRLIRERHERETHIHNLETQINERDRCIATLQATNEDQAAQLEHGMLENAELKTDNFRLQESLARCIEALRKRKDVHE
jgi:hypothetical protein